MNDKSHIFFATVSVLMLEKSYLHQNGVEFNFLIIGLASRPAISLRINPRIRADSKGVPLTVDNYTVSGLSGLSFNLALVSTGLSLVRATYCIELSLTYCYNSLQ